VQVSNAQEPIMTDPCLIFANQIANKNNILDPIKKENVESNTIMPTTILKEQQPIRNISFL